jgi:hypothetical protein
VVEGGGRQRGGEVGPEGPGCQAALQQRRGSQTVAGISSGGGAESGEAGGGRKVLGTKVENVKTSRASL